MEAKDKKNLLIKDAGLIVGDGKTVWERVNTVISGQRISYIGEERPTGVKFDRIIEGEDKWTLPGIINIHTHGIVPGAPLFSSASQPPPLDEVKNNLKRHLAQGTTTLLNLDGFVHPNQVMEASSLTPINLKTASTHYLKAYQAARQIDAQGLRGQREAELAQIVRDFPRLVVAIGEGGSGATLGGGVQDYKFIPEMVKKETGIIIGEFEARRLKEAVLGREISDEKFDAIKTKRVLKEIGLNDYSPSWVKEKIKETVLPSFNLSLKSLEEGARLAKRFRLPCIVHTAYPSIFEIESLRSLGPLLIAGHLNHPSFELPEAVSLAKKLKKEGVFIDISTFNILESPNKERELTLFFKFLEEELADTISTDYGGGNHSGILKVLELTLAEKVVSLPEVVAKVSSVPARIIPKLAPERGLVREGLIADLIMVNKERISQVEEIIIGGEVIKKKGKDALAAFVL